MRKSISISVLICFSLFLFAGCSKEKSMKKKIVLRWQPYASTIYSPLRKTWVKEFEKLHPEVQVRFEPISGNYYAKILTQMAGDTMADIFICTFTTDFMNREALLDLTSYIEKDPGYLKGIYPPLLRGNTYNGRVYSLPGNCGVDILYYNRDLFDREGLSYPDKNWTWKELFEAAKKLTKKDSSGRIIQYGLTLDWEPLLPIFQNGGRLWSEDMTKCVINSVQAKESIRFWKELYTNRFMPNPPTEALAAMDQFPVDIFITGKSAMYCGASWNVVNLKKKGKNINWDATLSPKPRKDSKRFVGLRYFCIGVYSKSKHPELAFKLAKFLISPDKIKEKIKLGDSLPLYKKGEDTDFYLSDPNRPEKSKEAMFKALEISESYFRMRMNPNISSSLEQKQIVNDGLQRIWFNLVSVDEGLQEIENKLNALLEENKRKKRRSENGKIEKY